MYLYVPECIYDASNFYGERQELEMRAAGVLAVVTAVGLRGVSRRKAGFMLIDIKNSGRLH